MLKRIFRAIEQEPERALPTATLRKDLIDLAKKEPSVLEIGPYYCPALQGDHVYYADVLSKNDLIEKARHDGVPPNGIPDIHFVTNGGDLSIIDRKFTAVYSAHCIEHQPDLVRHFRQVRDLLHDGGHYYLVIPDKRYCFDHFARESSVSDIIAAQGDTIHPFMTVVEQFALFTHNDPRRHWLNDHADPGYENGMSDRARGAIDAFQKANGDYIDLHRWRFLSSNFAQLIECLREKGLIRLKAQQVNETPRDLFEFTAILSAV